MRPKEKLNKEIPGGYMLALGAVLAALFLFADREIAARIKIIQADIRLMESAVEASGASLEELRVLRDLKSRDAVKYKEALKGVAKSRKGAYDAGFSLQEEKRLLEKQLEIMTTYLAINEETGHISLMRGDHSLKDFPFSYSPLRLFGNGTKRMPFSARVVSKERFAQPERGKVEESNGRLTWSPPQVGKDPRSGGLGEFVIFTDSPLVVHGPPLKKEMHEAYPHICAGVTAYTAKKIFESAFIGAKILYQPSVKTAPATQKTTFTKK